MDYLTNFKGKGKRLEAWDYGRIGRILGLTEDLVRAVAEVEAGGSGFDSLGRIKMLFEPHVFWRELGEQKRAVACNQGLAYPKWGSQPYPRDSYARLEMAMRIDRPAALRSCSWGMGQVMGFNHRACGYGTLDAMLIAFADDEEYQLMAMVNFIRSEGLDDDLRRFEWAAFARGYNGPKYADHGYHTKLAAAHAKWAKRADVVDPAAQ